MKVRICKYRNCGRLIEIIKKDKLEDENRKV